MNELDFSDPNFDFAGQAEILARALKRSQKLQDTPINAEGIGGPGIYARSSPLSGVGAFLSRGAGAYDQAQAEKQNSAMNSAQLQRYDELSRQINAPGTKVLKKTLGNVGPQEDGSALPGTQVTETVGLDYSNPDEAVLENSRKQALAAQMAKLNLPQAQKAAEIYLNKGAAFPETIAKMRMEQVERGEQNAMKLKEIEAQKERDAAAALERDRARAQDKKDMVMLAASLRPPPASKGGGEVDPAAADLIAARFIEGDKNALMGISRNANLHGAVMASIARQAKEQGVDAKELVMRGLEYGGASAEQRTVGTQAANVQMAANEANKMIDVATDLSNKVPRTEFPAMNAAGNVIRKQSGDPNVVAFNQSIDSLINGYARAINPKGVATVADKKRAHETLAAAFSTGQFDATTAVMRREMEAALAAPKTAREQARQARVGGGEAKPDQNADARAWLAANPNDPRAAAVRAKLEGK